MINTTSSLTTQQNAQAQVQTQAQAKAKAQQKLMDNKIFNTFKINAGSKTAYMPTGRLIKSKGPISGVAVGIKDTAIDAKNFVKALKNGDANDHSLGRMNDLGLKLGGALIAGYLASKKMPSASKAMEFIGFGSFLASMSLWPRLTIDAPIRLKNGFNIRQKYIDNEGRKKEFFQDNQYLPWDLWSNEDLNKIADKMGIDKNIKDREELTKKKMQKIALQGNTMWMLTCGLGVPLSTSMMCKALEKPLELAVIEKNILSATRKLNKITSNEVPGIDLGTSIDFAKLSGSLDDKAIKIFDEIDPLKMLKNSKDIDSRNIIKGLPDYSEKVLSDIRGILSPKYVDNADKFSKQLGDKLFSGIKYIGITGDEIDVEIPFERIADAVKTANTNDEVSFAQKLFKALNSDSGITMPGMSEKEFINAVNDLIENTSSAKASEKEALKKLSEQMKTIKKIQTKNNSLLEAVNSVFGQRTESVSTLGYNKIGSSLIDQLGIGKNTEVLKTIKEQNYEERAYQVAREYFEKSAKTIAGSDSEYADALIKLASGSEGGKGVLSKRINKIFSHMDEGSNISKLIDRTLQNMGSESGKLSGLKSIQELYDFQNKSGLKSFVSKFIRQSRLNIDSTSQRAIATLDFERRIADGSLEKFVMNRYGSADILSEFTELARKTIYNGTKNDFSSAATFVKAGKLDYWDGVIEFLFREPMADSTRKAIEEANNGEISQGAKRILEGFGEYRNKFINMLKPIAFNEHNEAYSISSLPSKENFLLTGKSVSEIIQDTSKKMYNNKHWLKIFGITTAAVVGITILSTTLFGKLKEQKLYEQQSSGRGNVA